jgi:hypothetical protein
MAAVSGPSFTWASVRLALVLPLVRREVAVVLDLDFSLAYGVADLFHVIGAFAAKRNFFGHARFLGDHCTLCMLFGMMRQIEILDDVRVRFPGRGPDFDLGIEVGAICVLMAQAEPVIRRSVSAEALEQLRPLAQRFRYVLVATPGEAGWDVRIS